jgi:exosortase H (IPTLxxWG-CTERM-specific)
MLRHCLYTLETASMARFIGIFLILVFTLFGLEMLEPIHMGVVEPFTGFLAKVSASIITPFDESVIAYDRIIQDSVNGFAISIESGCNGVEATIVLVAAVIAFPATWRQRSAAIFLGFLAIQVANILRIISLFYLGQWNMDMFTWIHLYLWPVLIMIDVLVVFILYLRYISKQPESPELTT